MRDSYEIRQKKIQAARDMKRKDLDTVIAAVDKLMTSALKPDSGYTAGELQDLNDARHSIMTVRGGGSRPLRR